MTSLSILTFNSHWQKSLSGTSTGPTDTWGFEIPRFRILRPWAGLLQRLHATAEWRSIYIEREREREGERVRFKVAFVGAALDSVYI